MQRVAGTATVAHGVAKPEEKERSSVASAAGMPVLVFELQTQSQSAGAGKPDLVQIPGTRIGKSIVLGTERS